MRSSFKLEEFLPFRLNLLAQQVSERLSGIYADRFGLDIPQWRIIANLASRGATTAQVIASVTHSHKSRISRAVRDLERRGLIERSVAATDRRSYSLQLTIEGKRLFRHLEPLVLDFERDLLASLGDADQRALLEGLASLERSLRRSEG